MSNRTDLDQSASFLYCATGGAAWSERRATLRQLAMHLQADWMPALPPSLNLVLVDFLNEALTCGDGPGDPYWAVDQAVAGCDRQWKAVASWLLGVAFCRTVVSSILSYPWCAHVSAFQVHHTLLPQGWPDAAFDPADCCVRAKEKKVLLPDFLLLRQGAEGTGYDLAFAESKGTAKRAGGMLMRKNPPGEWNRQKSNAELLVQSVVQVPLQELLVVTRVCPAGSDRRVMVRVWNERRENTVGLDVARRVLFAHYYGVCRRIGFQANAELLATAAPFLSVRRGSQRYTHGDARREMVTAPLGRGLPIAVARGRSFTIGGDVTTLALSEPAIRIIEWLGNSGSGADEKVVGSFTEQIARLGQDVHGTRGVVLREDGVLAFQDAVA